MRRLLENLNNVGFYWHDPIKGKDLRLIMASVEGMSSQAKDAIATMEKHRTAVTAVNWAFDPKGKRPGRIAFLFKKILPDGVQRDAIDAFAAAMRPHWGKASIGREEMAFKVPPKTMETLNKGLYTKAAEVAMLAETRKKALDLISKEHNKELGVKFAGDAWGGAYNDHFQLSGRLEGPRKLNLKTKISLDLNKDGLGGQIEVDLTSGRSKSEISKKWDVSYPAGTKAAAIKKDFFGKIAPLLRGVIE